MVRFLARGAIDNFCNQLRAEGCRVESDMRAGLIRVFDGDIAVLTAIEKFRDGPWITRFTSTDRITWADDAQPAA